GGEAGIAGICNVLPAAHGVSRLHPDRIPVEMRVFRVGAVIVQDAHEVRGHRVPLGIDPTAEIGARHLEHDAAARSVDPGTHGHDDVDRVTAVGAYVRHGVGECL